MISSAERVGRDGRLDLRFKRDRDGGTRLAQSGFSLPLQVLAPRALENGAVSLFLLNPTGGVLGGDHLTGRIALDAGAHVHLSTPSATRVYRTAREGSFHETEIVMGENAILEYFPDHVIPQAGSIFRQTLEIEMGAGCRAIVFDGMSSGRVGHGERWAFHEFDSSVTIRLNGKPAFANRIRIEPARRDPSAFGVMERYDYLASLVVAADRFKEGEWSRLASALECELKNFPDVYGGVGVLPRACAAKFLSTSAQEMMDAARALWSVARKIVLNLPPLYPRKY